MIVDDEPLFREYLRTKFNWQALGMTICCDARNGVEALEKAEANRPDIALVDINMPYMDGLELTERLKERYPDISIVLVTGHSEFEYARRAIRIGVKDYLLKPFNEEEFTMTLGKVKSFLQASRDKKEDTQDQFALMRESFLLKLISENISMKREDIEAAMVHFRIPVPPRYYLLAVTEIDHLRCGASEPAEVVLWNHTVDNMLRELVEIRGEHVLFHDAEGRAVSIMAFEDHEDGRAFNGEAFERLGQLVERHFRFTITTGFGRASEDFMELSLSYRDALNAIHNKLTAGQGNVIWHDKLSINMNSFEFFSMELQEKLIYSLRMKDWKAVEERLDMAFAYLGKTRTTVDHAWTGLMGLVSLGLSYAIESGQVISETFGPDFSPYQELRRMTTLEQCREWIVSLFQRVMEPSAGSRLSKASILYTAATQYIHDQYADPDLSVDRIAGHFFIDASYLRKIFKKEGEKSVSDYVFYIRMQKAKELIGGSELKLSVIAEQVGYSDANYFSKCFKKHFGMTPTEYENKKRQV